MREADDESVRKLEPGEHTTMAGHHVRWLPTDAAKVAVLLRIVDRLEAGATVARVARELTADGVPVPDPRGNPAGVWYPTTVRGLATHPLLRAVVETGKRAEGDQRRLTPDGPRPLGEADFQPGTRTPKAVVNPPAARIVAAARFAPVVEPARHEALVAKLERSGASQRGKPRARGDAPNPLGGRVWDMGCGWPLHRHPRGSTYRYLCSLYQQSDARACNHSWVDGPATAGFVVAAIRQRLLSPATLARLRARLDELAAAEAGGDAAAREAEATKTALARAGRERDLAARNLARAESDAQYRAVSIEFERLTAEQARLETEFRLASAARPDPAAEVTAAQAVLDRLPDLAARGEDAGAARELIEAIGAKLYLKFRLESVGRRVVSRPAGGVLTLGSAPPPVPLYAGRTDKAFVRPAIAAAGGVVPPELRPCSCDPGAEVESSGNRQRVTPRRGAATLPLSGGGWKTPVGSDRPRDAVVGRFERAARSPPSPR